jgi:bifunctional non-homologous end joining protein LigD
VSDLECYRAKRRPGRTPEPFDLVARRGSAAPVFVVQRHSARRLHYDFRLERNGVLTSWALPRGVPLRSDERLLAVQVEDHPLGYASFEGVIPDGEYGAGTVDLWDRGTYELAHEHPDGTLTVILHGQRLEGEWALIPASLHDEAQNWLIVRASADDEPGPMGHYEPMEPRAAARVPRSPHWVFELAWPGVRAIAPIEAARGRFEHSGPPDLEPQLRRLASLLPRALRTSDAVLDGVICRLGENGTPCENVLGTGGTLVYLVFDLLELEGRALVDKPWSVRRERLGDVLDARVEEITASATHDDGATLREGARALGLGIVAKRRASSYRRGVRDDWRLLPP